MHVEIDTNQVEARDRPEFVHEALGGALVPLDLYWPEAGAGAGADAHGYVAGLGELTVCSGRTTAIRVERTPKMARQTEEPSVFVNVQHFGSSLVVQHGREVVGRPGDLVMYDAASPYTMLNDTGVTGDFFQIPHSALALPSDMIREACAVTLSPGHPIAALAENYLRRLASEPNLFVAENGDLAARPSIELIRAVIMTHLRGPERRPGTTSTASLQVCILEYARQHLHEPELSAKQIAAANYISVRQLYSVLAESGISLSDWIRTRRLEDSRHALADRPSTTTIAAVARKHGFINMSSYSRAFRNEYGMTPREWRDRSRLLPQETP